MDHITQHSLALDKEDAFEQNEDAKKLLEQEDKLLEEINTFKDALASAQSELTKVRRKLRILRKKHGTHVTTKEIIFNYVKQNPGKHFSDLVKYLEGSGIMCTSYIAVCKQRGIILENLDGTYSPGNLLIKLPKGVYTSIVMDYARSNKWFTIKECYEYLNTRFPDIYNTLVYGVIINNKDRFEVDRSGKYIKYRLKDEYRSL
jgi:CRISPR/Cas system-associated protein Cas10 (large subunit of type III CRISPR-Cas system)